MQIDVTFLSNIVKAVTLQNSDSLKHALTTVSGRAYMLHEHVLNRKTTVKKIVDSFEHGSHGYNFQGIKKNIGKIETIEKYICDNQLEIADALVKQIRKYSGAKTNSSTVICLYALGYDGGFFLYGNKIFINVSQCLDNWFAIITHEMYHAGKMKFRSKIDRVFCNMTLLSNASIIHKMSVLFAEEGIATLIENDGKKQENIVEIRDKYSCLKKIIILTHHNKIKKMQVWEYFNEHNLRYQLGWLIAYEIYEEFGVEGLDCWSINGDINRYFESELEWL